MAACLDTSFLFDLLAQRPNAVAYADSLEPPVAISAVSLYDLLAGEERPTRIARIESLADDFAVVPAGVEVCMLAASIQTALRARGRFIPHFDALIAATSILADAPLVTADAHFRDIPGEFGLVLRAF